MTSQSQPVTPVRVPKAATAYTPTTQDPDLRSQINTLLLREGHIEKIEQTLDHALHAHPSNWPQKVALHALALLRSGECTTFPKLMERVLEDVRRDTAATTATTAAAAAAGTAGTANAAAAARLPGPPAGLDLAAGLRRNQSVGQAGNKAGGGSTSASASAASVGSGTSGTSGSGTEAQRKGGAGKANGAVLGKGKALAAAAAAAAEAGVGVMNGVVVNGVAAEEGIVGLAVPQTVIEEGIRITRECLEQVCEVDN